MRAEQNTCVVSSVQVVFSFWTILFVLMFIGGYALNLLGWPAHPLPIFIFVCLGFSLIVGWASLRRVCVTSDLYELGGFLLVCLGVWLYLITPALPTWLPPSYSGDPALHYAFADQVLTTGQIIGNDPGGPTLVVAMFAQWLGIPLVRVLHPITALWLALTAGAIYGLVCTLLPPRVEAKLFALGAPIYLLLTWDCFAGLILGAHYFVSQAAGQFFVIAFTWYLAEWIKRDHPFFKALVIATFVAVWVTYHLWLVVPAVLLAWVIREDKRANGTAWQRVFHAGAIAAVILLFFMLATRWTGKEFIPFLEHLRVDGAVIPPTLVSFGGVLIPVVGWGFYISNKKRLSTVLALFVAVITQTLLLVMLHFFFGAGKYWYTKSLFLWVFPLALFGVVALEHAHDWLARRVRWRGVAPIATALVLITALWAIVWRAYPNNVFVPLADSDLQVALWAKENLNTSHIHYIGPKSVVAQWLGVGLWGEKYPSDLAVDLARLGPRTFEEWYNAPGWGEYLFISSTQRHPLTPDMRVVYRYGDSMIVQKPTASTMAVSAQYAGAVLSLVDFDLPSATFRSGERLVVSTRIQAHRLPPRRVVWRLQLRDMQDNFVTEARFEPFGAQFPLQRWPPGIVLTQTFTLTLPVEIPPGLYNLQLGLYFVRDGAPLSFTSAEGQVNDLIHLGRVKVGVPRVTMRELAELARTDVQIGEAVSLLGYRVQPTASLYPGDSLTVILYWHARARVANDYTVFVHLLDSAGMLVAQRDSAPRNGTYPTSMWEQDEIIPDVYELTIPNDATPGDYYLIVGMYQWPQVKRLPVTDPAQGVLGDHFELPITIRVE